MYSRKNLDKEQTEVDMGLFDILFGKRRNTGNQDIDQNFFEDWSLKRSRATLLKEMKEMFKRNFYDYEICYDYPAAMLKPNSHPACAPIQFMFKKGEKNVLAVVVVKQNTYRGMNVIGTKQICDDLRIPYIRFFEEYPNKEEYVVSRVRSYLEV